MQHEIQTKWFGFESVLTLIDFKKFPIVVFSHGLGGSMEMYTQLCQHIASYGYIVVAMEHEDGSACYAETVEGQAIPYQRPPYDTSYTREKVVHFRRPFLNQRVKEVQQVLDGLERSSPNPLLDRILARHKARKKLYPDTPPAFGMPYEGVENIRPETQAAVDAYVVRRDAPKQ